MTYPYQAWILTPTFTPKEVTVAGEYWMRKYRSIVGLSRPVHLDDLHPTKQEAIGAGFAKLEVARAKIKKQLATIEKRTSNLKKASEQ